MLKRAIWVIVALLVAAYFVNSYIENKAKKEAQKAEAERIEKATKTAVDQLAKRTNAVDNWEKDLSKGEQFRLEPILTLELERLWLTHRPILFIGSIKDISTIDQENYRIKIERTLFGLAALSICLGRSCSWYFNVQSRESIHFLRSIHICLKNSALKMELRLLQISMR